MCRFYCENFIVRILFYSIVRIPLCKFYLRVRLYGFHCADSIYRFHHVDFIMRILSCRFYCTDSVVWVLLCRFHCRFYRMDFYCANSIVQILILMMISLCRFNDVDFIVIPSCDHIVELHCANYIVGIASCNRLLDFSFS